MRERRRLAPSLGVIATLLALAALAAPSAQASLRCRLSAGPLHILRIDPFADDDIDLDFADATVRRSGKRILVLDNPFDRPRNAIDCAGPRATVFNTDSIDVFQTGLSFATIDLSGGALAPGFSAEEDGSNEIETRFATDIDALGYGIVTGTPENDDWRVFGGDDDFGLSLDPARPEEADVTYAGLGISVAVLEPGEGADRVDAGALAVPDTLMLVKGGPGADSLIGSPFRDALEGGTGTDIIESGGGGDRVDCGAGSKDRAQVDRRDRLKGCEQVHGPRVPTQR